MLEYDFVNSHINVSSPESNATLTLIIMKIYFKSYFTLSKDDLIIHQFSYWLFLMNFLQKTIKFRILVLSVLILLYLAKYDHNQLMFTIHQFIRLGRGKAKYHFVVCEHRHIPHLNQQRPMYDSSSKWTFANHIN